MPGPVFESPRPLSQSRLWGLLLDFYREQGPDAWGSGRVPQRPTSNGYLADVYAAIAGAFLGDWSRGGGRQTPLILEVGGGSGLFAWLFLNRLAHHRPVDQAVPDFDYLLTDASASNVEAWRAIPRLRGLVDAGSLHLGVLKIGGDVAVEMSSPGRGQEMDLTGRPVVLIANYVLDAVPCDVMRFRQGRVFQELISLRRTDQEGERAVGFRRFTPRFESKEIQEPYTGHAGVDEVLRGYRDLSHEACVPVSLETVRFLESFLRGDFPFLMLAGDLAYTTPDFAAEPPLLLREYAARTVNFHMLGKIFEQWGGDTRFGQEADARFSVGAFLKPSPTVDLALTRDAARHGLYHFTPHDAHHVEQALGDHPGPLDFRTVCAWLRLARFDAHSARRCIPHLIRTIEEGGAWDRKILHGCLMEAYRCDLPQAAKAESLDTDIAFVFMKAGMYQETAELLTMSMPESGRSAERLYLSALALNRLGRPDEASRLLVELLEREPAYWSAMTGAPADPPELVAWLLAVEGDDRHLDHIVLRLSVAAFARVDASPPEAGAGA